MYQVGGFDAIVQGVIVEAVEKWAFEFVYGGKKVDIFSTVGE